MSRLYADTLEKERDESADYDPHGHCQKQRASNDQSQLVLRSGVEKVTKRISKNTASNAKKRADSCFMPDVLESMFPGKLSSLRAQNDAGALHGYRSGQTGKQRHK